MFQRFACVLDTTKQIKGSHMDINIINAKTMTVFRSNMLKNRVKGGFNLIAAGTPRGGTSILGLLLKIFDFEMGDNVHHDKYEDLDLHMTDISNWGELIKKKINNTPNWSVKYPAATRHLDLFYRYCPKPVFLIIIRNPFTVVKSMIDHDPEYSNKANDYYKSMEITLESYAQFNRNMQTINAPFIVLEHEKIIANPALFIQEFVDTLNIKTDQATIDKAIYLISSPGYKRIEDLDNNC